MVKVNLVVEEIKIKTSVEASSDKTSSSDKTNSVEASSSDKINSVEARTDKTRTSNVEARNNKRKDGVGNFVFYYKHTITHNMNT